MLNADKHGAAVMNLAMCTVPVAATSLCRMATTWTIWSIGTFTTPMAIMAMTMAPSK